MTDERLWSALERVGMREYVRGAAVFQCANVKFRRGLGVCTVGLVIQHVAGL